MVFLGGYPVTSSYGLPDTGYIAMEEMCHKIQEAVRQVSIPVMADGDTGDGSRMNVDRTVECYAAAGAAGVMIEDQTWPKRCGHTKGKSVASRGEAFARTKAACDARDEGKDIFVLARTDALILGWDEAMARAKEFKRIGVDAVFVEALPDREAMKACASRDWNPNIRKYHRGRKDGEPIYEGFGRTRFLCCRVTLDACCSEAQEHPGNSGGFEAETWKRNTNMRLR